jgi:phosphoribosylglycinamide formyltransferase 1
MNKQYVILISGRGSNMMALIEAKLPGRCAAVIADRPEAKGLAWAAERGIPTTVVNFREFDDRAAFDVALAAEIDRHAPDLVLLAGFMRIVGEGFVRAYEGRLVNIHPSLLPSFPGLKTHAKALSAGVKLHGCTVHFVTPDLDCGPTIIQAAVSVLDDDTPDTLAARVLAQEHIVYPRAARWFLEGRLTVTPEGQVRVADGAMTAKALRWPEAE